MLRWGTHFKTQMLELHRDSLEILSLICCFINRYLHRLSEKQFLKKEMLSFVSIQCAAAVSNSHFQAKSDSFHNIR